MYKRVQKKTSSRNPVAGQQGEGLWRSRPSSVQAKTDTESSSQPEIPKYSRTARDSISTRILKTIDANQQRQASAEAQEPQSESQKKTDELTPEGVAIQSQQESGADDKTSHKGGTVQRLCSECEAKQHGQQREADDQIKSVQTKLVVGDPGDKYEQEADQMAAQVMSMDAPTKPQIQHQNQEPEESVQRQPLAASITPLIQRSSNKEVQIKPSVHRAGESRAADTTPSLESRLASRKGGGSPIDTPTRSFMESRFGTDFSQVRVHADGESVQMNKELGAQAFTQGHDIHFGAGKYNPGSGDGKRLLAHELTHVVQQTGAVQPKSIVEPPNEQSEQKENRGADAVMQMPESATREGVVVSGQTLAPTNAKRPPENFLLQAEAKQKALKPKEEAGRSDKHKFAHVEVVPQQKQSPSATETTSEAKTQGEARPAKQAVQAVNPQQQVRLPQEVTERAEGKQAKGKDGAGKTDDKKIQQAQAHKQPIAHNQAASHKPEGKSEATDLKPKAHKQQATAADEQGKARLEATNAQAQQLASAGVKFALPKEEKAGQFEKRPVIAMKAESPGGDSATQKDQSAKASSIATGFLATASGKVQTITDLGTKIPARILAAAENAKASVMAAVEQQKASVSAHIAQQRAKAQGEAQATIAKIQTQSQAAIAAFPKETAKAREKVESEYKTSAKLVDTREKSQITQIEGIYAQAANEFRSAGARVGDDAIKIADQKANEYRSRDSGAAQFASNIGLGAISDVAFGTDSLKNKARAQAAEEVGQAYKKGLIDKANECAQQAQQGKKKDIETVHQTAAKSRETLQTQHKTALDSLNAAEQQAKQQAQQMQTHLTEAAHHSLEATLTSLNQQQATQLQTLTAQGQQQITSIEGSAQHAISSLQNAIHQSASGLQRTLQTFQTKANTTQAPNPEALSAAVAQAQGKIDAEVGKIQAQVEQGVAASAQSIMQSGQQSVATFASIGQGAIATATTLSQGFTTSMTSLAQSATDNFTKIQQSHTNTATQTATTAVDGFKKVTEGIQKTFDEMNKGLESQFQQHVKGIEKGLRGALDKLPGDINTEADKAAAQVDPKKELLKLVLIVAVVVVVALVVGPFAAGLLAPLGTLGTILAGAAVGALSAAAIQLGNNIIDGKKGLDIFQGVGQAALIGAVTGALGAGIGIGLDKVAAKFGAEAVKSFAGKFALDVGKNFVNDIALNISTGQFNWDNIGQSLLLAVLTAGVTQSKFGRSIHEGSYGKGIDVGDSINSGIKKTFGGLSGDRTSTDISTPTKHPVSEETAPAKPPVPDNSTSTKPPVAEETTPTKPPASEETTSNRRSTHFDEPEVEPGVVAKEPASDGHTIKVLEDGSVVICSVCARIRKRYSTELERRPDLRQELDEAEALSKPKQKAARAKEIEAQLRSERMAGSNGPIPPELYETLRASTPSREIREFINDVPGEKVDPVYGYKVDAFEADHIVSMKTITEMEGFSKLSWENQMKVLNNPENFMGLGKKTNSSKQDKSWAEWEGHSELGPVPEAFKKQMIQKEEQIKALLQKQIESLLATQ